AQAAGVSASLSAAGAASTAQVATHSLEGRCGGAGSRCRIKVQVSEGLRELVQGVAVVFPRINGRIAIDGSRASGKITFSGTFKTKVGKVGNGAPVEVAVEPTASTVVSETAGEVVLSNARVTASGAGMQGGENFTLRFRHNGAQEAWFEVTRGDIRVGDKNHTVRLVLPLVRG
ncbi:MAG: hypothetical protein M3P24_07390, partial [Gemmatimonadota bacterium]|nr:hypothetical protein [Gemmatimonadota bacterium]